MVKLNVVRMAVLGALAIGSVLSLGAGSPAQAQDLRAPMVRSEGPRDLSANALSRIAQARGGQRQRTETPQQRSGAMERRVDPKPAQMKRADPPARQRGETTRASHGTPRSR